MENIKKEWLQKISRLKTDYLKCDNRAEEEHIRQKILHFLEEIRLRQRKDTSKCSWIGCRQLAEIGWLGYPLCDKHWDKYCKMQEKKEFKADLREWV